MKKLTPLAGYLLIEPMDEQDQKTSGGLILPEKAKEKPAKGKIIAKGLHSLAEMKLMKEISSTDPASAELMKRHLSSIEKGDIVVYHRWSGQDIKEGDKEYKLVQFKDLMGVYE